MLSLSNTKDWYQLLYSLMERILIYIHHIPKRQAVLSVLTTIPGQLLNSLWKWGHFDRAKPNLKLLLASWTFYSFLKGFRSFIAENLGSVGQRALKLPAVKFGGHKKKSAHWPRPLSNQSARIRVVPGSNHSQCLMASDFAVLSPIEPKFLAKKDLNPF